MFIHLRTRSNYSFLSSLASPANLVDAAAQAGMPALALTDYHSLTGAVEFYDACRSADVQPILGLELSVASLENMAPGEGSLALLAMDLQGWSSLCRLSSAVQAGQGLPFERLVQDSTGLICLTGGKRGQLAGWLRGGQGRVARAYLARLEEAFPGRLYLELQDQEPGDKELVEQLVALAQDRSLPFVATNPVHYLAPEDADRDRLLAAIRLNRGLDQVPDRECAPEGSYFKTAAEMGDLFAGYPAATAATHEISSRCQLELPLGVPHFPAIQLPAGSPADEVLQRKAQDGAIRLYGQITPEIAGRLEHELRVIGERGYAPLFLIMEEIIQYAREQGIPVSSRGSAASSLVAHCLDITSPDPIRLNLYFERFLNPARATPPDIDTDLCSRRRDEVIRFVYRRFGEERVAMVCTINRFRRRSALREVAKAHGLPSAEIKKLVDDLPHRWWGPEAVRSRPGAPYADLAERYSAPLYQTIFQSAASLLGAPHHLSIHPGGIVISPGPMTDLVPTQLAAKGVLITQFDLDAIERFGLVKIDLLGIRGLTVLGDVAQAIQERSPETYPAALDVLKAISEDDAETAELVQNGRTIGCFQIESPGMRQTLREIQARSVDDVMAALALYRPGPLTGGLKDAFVRRHKGEEDVSQLHPALTPLLEDTYGVILYQEQVLRIANELAGLSLADADLLRRAMSHFDPGEQMRTLKERFIAGAVQHSGVPETIADRVWQLMAAFAGYGFPKAHAASYAQVAWRAAWCKTREPAVFLAAVLANWGGYYNQSIYLNEARRMGLRLLPPHVNFARREFSVHFREGQPELVMGLDQVRDLTRRTQAQILRKRHFQSLPDFLARADPRPAEAENLIRAGALEGLGTIPELLSQLQSGSWRRNQLPLFNMTEWGGRGTPALEDWSLEEKVTAQEEVLGVGVIAHRLELVSAQIADSGAVTTVEAAAQLGRQVRVAGTQQIWRPSRTSQGEKVYFMSLEDLEGMLDVLIPEDVYRRSRGVFSSRHPFVLEGVVHLDHARGEPFIRAEKAWKLI
ncbi:MAG TPA: DNA polymerase III subunit alpha [Anaerolineales bacterium]